MISEEQQDQAALYALDLLDAGEISAFEAAMNLSAELRDLVRELREAASSLAFAFPAPMLPPASLKEQVMSRIAKDQPPLAAMQGQTTRPTSFEWIPWAIAALLLVFCGALAFDRLRLQHQLAEMRASDPLMQTTFFSLAPTGPVSAEAKATVAWQPGRQSGVLKISNLPAPKPGQDYQLWVIDANHKDPVSAGVVRVDKNGVAQVRFRPVDTARQVKAFAISLEREGGVPKKEGPILLVGSA